VDYIHLVARAIQASFADRARFMGDPRFLTVPIERLCSVEYGAELAALVRSDRAIGIADIGYRESMHTTHVCVLDAEGNAVSLTHTLGSASAVITQTSGSSTITACISFIRIPASRIQLLPARAV
jgi:gamma-glutamyltranspeptidase/glutathione hydrolase